ncbi:hypothetical protein MMPV_003721 [Pyropia vietnamensis]
MHGLHRVAVIASAVTVGVLGLAAASPSAGTPRAGPSPAVDGSVPIVPVSYGPPPFFLVDDVRSAELRTRLAKCAEQKATPTAWSIGHRGAPLMFPEHTKESYIAAARMGAGIIECDVTFTKDKQLVCRHAQCDLHTSTNILLTPLAAKCTTPFSPATNSTPATALCCASDVTLAEFRTLTGKMDGADETATNVEAYTAGTPGSRTDLYSSGGATGTLLTHAESITLIRSLGARFTPELKPPAVDMPFRGLTKEGYAQALIDEYKAARVPPEEVWPQSFDLDDVRYWLSAEPRFGRQAIYLDGRYDEPTFNHTRPASWAPSMDELFAAGVRTLGSPLWMLLREDGDAIRPSVYAAAAKAAGIDIIAWTLERSGSPPAGWYFQTLPRLVESDGDVMVVLDALAQQVQVRGVFTDWPATVTYYANCMGL